ncbi:MAG: hypothetical protein ACRDQZ_19445 [Mycobacteriales bacterium]
MRDDGDATGADERPAEKRRANAETLRDVLPEQDRDGMAKHLAADAVDPARRYQVGVALAALPRIARHQVVEVEGSQEVFVRESAQRRELDSAGAGERPPRIRVAAGSLADYDDGLHI